jgi:hypothetical protein
VSLGQRLGSVTYGGGKVGFEEGRDVTDQPSATTGSSVEDEPLAAFTDEGGPGPNRVLRIVVVVVVVALVLGAVAWWWRSRPTDPQQAAQLAASACDSWTATKNTGSTIADFGEALSQSRDAVRLDPIWTSLDRSLFSAIDALVYLKKVPAAPTRAQQYAANTMSVQYYQATQALADQCALAKSRS